MKIQKMYLIALFLMFIMRVSQKFYNILIGATLWHVHHMTEAVQAMEVS